MAVNCDLLTLNISGPSLGRAERLADYLLSVDADFLILTETRDNQGTQRLISVLAESGYEAHAPVPPTAGERGVAVLGRANCPSADASSAATLSHRLLTLDVGESLRLIAAYVPSRDASQTKIERKRLFLEQMSRVVERSAAEGRVVFMGDLNIVGRDHEPRYPMFRTWEYDALEHFGDCGLVDAYSVLHLGIQAHSWIGRTGNGYRYDYAFVSRELIGSVESCEYLHGPRTSGLSDHAALALRLSM